MFNQQQQINIHKLYKHQYNTQNKQYKTYKEQIINQTPKDLIKEKLEQIKDEQNRKFSLLYEHYKTNLEAVYQQQSLKLTGNQQLEQDQLNDDLEKQMSVLFQSHMQRKQQQAETFLRENELLEAERQQRFKDLDVKIKCELDEFDNNSKQRLSRLKDEQKEMLDRFDKVCYEKYGVLLGQNNRHSVYNFNMHRNSSSSNSPNLNGYFLFFAFQLT